MIQTTQPYDSDLTNAEWAISATPHRPVPRLAGPEIGRSRDWPFLERSHRAQSADRFRRALDTVRCQRDFVELVRALEFQQAIDGHIVIADAPSPQVLQATKQSHVLIPAQIHAFDSCHLPLGGLSDVRHTKHEFDREV